jgi:photosystem II stability/assembly factor-like uncharacterized protein
MTYRLSTHFPSRYFIGICAIFFLGFTLLGALNLTLFAQDSSPKDTSRFKNIKFRNIGPAAGGRVSRACGVVGDPLTYYAATASGGVWKSSDGGKVWNPIFDDQPIASIGAIAVSVSDPHIIYVGSGEANIRGNVAPGNGIYKSTDAGKTWKHVWKQEGQIGTMIIHPKNPDIAFAAVLGHAFGPNKERGVYRTLNGGKTWEKVLYKNEETGASDVCFDPSNPTILFAGLWQARRRPWELTSGGAGSGLYVSRDGGDSWKQLSDKNAEGLPSGLPSGIWGKVGVAVAPTNGQRVYALIENENGGLFRSDNGGESWAQVNDARGLRQRAWYYSTMTIHPKNPDVVFFPQVPMLKTIDGGKTLQRVRGIHHGDHHDIWIDPNNPDRMISANDGGVDVTTSGGASWYAPPLPITQFYHVATDNRTLPYYVSGCAQDLGTYSGPSNSLIYDGIQFSSWYTVGGGEAGYTAHHPVDSNIVYAGEYGGIITRYDARTKNSTNISIYPTNPSGRGGEDLRYRFQWTAPILISPHDPNTLYHAANVLFKTSDNGTTWTPISPDLTRNDKSKQKWSGGPITGDNTGVEVYCTIFAIAESPVKQGVLWAGSDDGLVHCSQDGGKTWANVTKNIPDFPEWGTVKTIEASKFDAGTAYVVVSAHRMDDMKPYLWKTTDFGKTWKKLSGKMAQDVYLHVVREDPKKRGLLFVGSEKGVMFSMDDGVSWTPLKLNLPTVAVHDMVVKNNDLVLGTHGRSFWILDDLTPIREAGEKAPSTDIALLPPLPTTRWIYGSAGNDMFAMPNPQQGVVLHYWLKNPVTTATIDILDAKGVVIQSLKNTPAEKPVVQVGDYGGGSERDTVSVLAGLHRINWDLTHKGAEFIKDGRTDGGDPTTGPLAAPGTYTIRFSAGGKIVSQEVKIAQDPRQTLSLQQVEQSVNFSLMLRDTISSLTRKVHLLRSLKKQLTTRNEILSENEGSNASIAALVKQSKEVFAKCDSLENKFHNAKAKVNYDILAGINNTGAKLYSILCFVNSWWQYNDAAPTQGAREVVQEEIKRFEQYSKELTSLINTDLAALNKTAQASGIPHIYVLEQK